MNRDDELTLRQWLRARDPGPARATLREAARAVPAAVRPARFPSLDLTLRAGFGLAPIARPLTVLLIVLLALAALAGATVLQPWRPFPPRGLLAYTTPLSAAGSSGIVIAASDGGERRQVGASVANRFDHSPRWSLDGRTLLFARTTALDPLASCGGVGSVVLYDLATSTERVVATGLRPMNVIEWSPSGDLAAYTYPPPGCGTQVELGVVDLRTGQVTTTIVLPADSEFDPSSGIKWHVEWSGEQPRAVPDAIVTAAATDFTTLVVVPSHAGRLQAHVVTKTPEQVPALGIFDSLTGSLVDLGPGGPPGWSPDDGAIAYLQPGGPAGPNLVGYVRDHLVIASAATGERRAIADVLMPDAVASDQLPKVSWTSDGEAVYWLDPMGGHVVDVVTGRSADLIGLPEVCDDIQWQPVSL